MRGWWGWRAKYKNRYSRGGKAPQIHHALPSPIDRLGTEAHSHVPEINTLAATRGELCTLACCITALPCHTTTIAPPCRWRATADGIDVPTSSCCLIFRALEYRDVVYNLTGLPAQKYAQNHRQPRTRIAPQACRIVAILDTFTASSGRRRQPCARDPAAPRGSRGACRTCCAPRRWA